ncbi:hypothetical protein HYS03_00460 [Candidatus Woesebacteria bacterium]|nr:hypothetical protein [Candidatus Woesebacteria bacterium]QQG47638.1 MAG: hypothetical protein HY044_00950 [Candidatus Woesebacteria bacterium]
MKLTDIPLSPPGGFSHPFGPLGQTNNAAAPSQFTNFLSSVIGVMTIIAAIWFTFIFISGGIGIISSGEDKGALENARKRITTGIIGLFVVVAAVFVINLIGNLLGFGSILNPIDLINQVKPR